MKVAHMFPPLEVRGVRLDAPAVDRIDGRKPVVGTKYMMADGQYTAVTDDGMQSPELALLQSRQPAPLL